IGADPLAADQIGFAQELVGFLEHGTIFRLADDFSGHVRHVAGRVRRQVDVNGAFPREQKRLDTRTIMIQSGKHNVSEVYDKVADIIAETSEIDRDKITPESNTIDDLGIDS